MKHNVQIGLKENWRQFTLLIIVNAFVGGMIGIERTIFPQFAELEFGIASKTAILSFITAFGTTDLKKSSVETLSDLGHFWPNSFSLSLQKP